MVQRSAFQQHVVCGGNLPPLERKVQQMHLCYYCYWYYYRRSIHRINLTDVTFVPVSLFCPPKLVCVPLTAEICTFRCDSPSRWNEVSLQRGERIEKHIKGIRRWFRLRCHEWRWMCESKRMLWSLIAPLSLSAAVLWGYPFRDGRDGRRRERPRQATRLLLISLNFYCKYVCFPGPGSKEA